MQDSSGPDGDMLSPKELMELVGHVGRSTRVAPLGRFCVCSQGREYLIHEVTTSRTLSKDLSKLSPSKKIQEKLELS